MDALNWNAHCAAMAARYETGLKTTLPSQYLDIDKGTDQDDAGQGALPRPAENPVPGATSSFYMRRYGSKTAKKVTELSQDELMAYLAELQRYLLKVWQTGKTEGLVRAARYAWHTCTVFTNLPDPQLLPRAFVTVAKTLDIFGDLVYKRLCARAAELLDVAELPEDFLAMDIPDEPVEMCQNWIHRVSRTRLLIPRLLLQIALWRVNRFLHDDFKTFFDASLLSFAKQIRGISDPALAAHLMWFLCYKAQQLDDEYHGALGVEYAERLLSDHYIVTAVLKDGKGARPGLSPAGYRSLLMPGLQWVVRALVLKSEVPFAERWAECGERGGRDVAKTCLLQGYAHTAPDEVIECLPEILAELDSYAGRDCEADTTAAAAEGYDLAHRGPDRWELEGEGLWGLWEAIGRVVETSVLSTDERKARAKEMKASLQRAGKKAKIMKVAAYPETEKGRRELAKRAWAALTKEASAERARRKALEEQEGPLSPGGNAAVEGDAAGPSTAPLRPRAEDTKFLRAIRPWVGYTARGLTEHDVGNLFHGIAKQVQAPLDDAGSAIVAGIIADVVDVRGGGLDVTMIPPLFDLLSADDRSAAGRKVVASVLGLTLVATEITTQVLNAGAIEWEDTVAERYHVDPVVTAADDDDDDGDGDIGNEARNRSRFHNIKAGNASLGSLLDICRAMHDQLSPMGDNKEALATARLFAMLVQRVTFDTKEAHLDFLLDCRRSFYKLPYVLAQVVEVALALARPRDAAAPSDPSCRALHKERAFVKACVTFCHITTPGLMDPVLRILGFCLAGLVAAGANASHHKEILFEAGRETELGVETSEERAVSLYFKQAGLLLQLGDAAGDADGDGGAEGDTFADRLSSVLAVAAENPKKGAKRVAQLYDVLATMFQVSANPDIANVRSRTPLCDACCSDDTLALVEAWVEQGADIAAANADSETPYRVAVRAGSKQVAGFLKEKGGK